MSKKVRGQSGLEYTILAGFLVFVLMWILGMGYYYRGIIEDSMRGTQVNNLAKKLLSTAESVYYSGEPSKATIVVYIPEGVKSIQVINNEIWITWEGYTGLNNNSFSSKVPISIDPTSPLKPVSGFRKVEIKATPTEAVIAEK